MVDCKTCEYEKVCEMPDFVRKDVKKCRTYQQKIPQTNGQKIRAMSDEELAEFLKQYMSCGFCDARDRKNGCKDCNALLLEWLKSEAKE